MFKIIFWILIGFILGGNFPNEATHLATQLSSLWSDFVLAVDLNIRGVEG